MVEYVTRTGNPSLLNTKTYKIPSAAKTAMRKTVADFREWAAKFNLDLMARCDTVNIELKELKLAAIPIGQTRRWELTDEPSGITLVVEVEKTNG